jgi:hypothetical protein
MLRDSHLIPKSAYRYLRMIGSRGNLNPTFLSPNKILQTSRQVTDYLLCEACEQRLNNRGERWCLEHCDRGHGQFKLLKILGSAIPRWSQNGFTVFDAASIPDIDVESLVHFGLSVFWRAAVHTWRTHEGDAAISLGPYEESIRRFLLDELPFPDKVIVTVRVSMIGNTFWLPVQKNHGRFHTATFAMLGLAFHLSVGRLISPELYALATAPNPRKPIWMVKSLDDFEFAEITKVYAKATA